MTKWSYAFSTALLVAVTPLSSVAQTPLQPNTTGNAFLSMCTPQSPSYQGCVWYVIGFTDGLSFTNAVLEKLGRKRLYCTPPSASNGSMISNVTGVQAIDMLFSYLQRHPQYRHELTPKLLLDTYQEAWPCPEK